jgi:hypothetical protein
VVVAETLETETTLVAVIRFVSKAAPQGMLQVEDNL